MKTATLSIVALLLLSAAAAAPLALVARSLAGPMLEGPEYELQVSQCVKNPRSIPFVRKGKGESDASFQQRLDAQCRQLVDSRLIQEWKKSNSGAHVLATVLRVNDPVTRPHKGESLWVMLWRVRVHCDKMVEAELLPRRAKVQEQQGEEVQHEAKSSPPGHGHMPFFTLHLSPKLAATMHRWGRSAWRAFSTAESSVAREMGTLQRLAAKEGAVY
ncbi:MAG: hypothetical protein M1826_007365 [Phylliscum demangeonii]|nr:MAG: hypothetical protein M1826_007365 [Phylliscum demangeonii]